MKVEFFGTPQFAADVLQCLLDNHIDVVCVITKPDKPKGRSGAEIPTPVKQTALQRNPPIDVYQPELVSAPAFEETLKKYEADLFVVVAYGEILKQHLLDMPKKGCINLHASLLPKYRGAAPIQRCIIEGEGKTGVTIIHMAKKMDAGDMIKTAEVAIGSDMTYGELEQELLKAGSELLLDVIRGFERGIVPRTPQDHAQATFAPRIELEDCQVDWRLPAQDVHNLIRGVNPEPGAWCFVSVRGQKKRLKILKTKLEPSFSGHPGEIVSYNKEGFIIGCGDQAVRLVEIQLEGKKCMPAEELMRGLPLENIAFQALN